MTFDRIQTRLETFTGLALLFVPDGAVISLPALGQEKKDAAKADSVFDDEKKPANPHPRPRPPSPRPFPTAKRSASARKTWPPR